MVRQALLDDWVGVKSLWFRFIEGPFSTRVAGDIGTIENYFATSLTSFSLRFLVLEVEGSLRGFSIVHDAIAPDGAKVQFLRVVHIEPGTSPEHAQELSQALNAWARAQGSTQIIGYCSMDFPLKAYERLHGVKALYILVGKDVV